MNESINRIWCSRKRTREAKTIPQRFDVFYLLNNWNVLDAEVEKCSLINLSFSARLQILVSRTFLREMMICWIDLLGHQPFKLLRQLLLVSAESCFNQTYTMTGCLSKQASVVDSPVDDLLYESKRVLLMLISLSQEYQCTFSTDKAADLLYIVYKLL